MIVFFVKLLMLFFMESLGEEPISKVDTECSRFAYEYRIMETLINIKNENAQLSARIKSLEEQQKKSKIVASHVRLSKTTPLTGYERVLYDVEVLNTGDVYDMERGQFKVPVSGLYLIHLTLCLGSGGQWMDLDIIRDSSVIGRLFNGDHAYHSCSSTSIATNLETGEKVWVERSAGTATSLNQDHGWNTFTVELLHAD